jgi:heme A synthase
LKLSKWMRQAHRILSIAFTAAALVNIVAMLRQDSAVWIGLLALVPLILLLVSGLYLFALPYMRKENRISSELQDAGAR